MGDSETPDNQPLAEESQENIPTDNAVPEESAVENEQPDPISTVSDAQQAENVEGEAEGDTEQTPVTEEVPAQVDEPAAAESGEAADGTAAPESEETKEETTEEGAADQPLADGETAPAEAVLEGEEGLKPEEEGDAAPAEGEENADAEQQPAAVADGEETEPKEGEEGGTEKVEGEEASAEKVEGETNEEEKAEGEDGVADKVDGEEGSTEKPEGGEEQGEGYMEAIKEGVDEEEAAKLEKAFEDTGRDSPPRVGERLDEAEAEGVPGMEGQDAERIDVAETPRFEEEEEEYMDEEEEEEETFYDREALIEKYRQATQERKVLMEMNGQLQNKLAEYFRKKKADAEAAGAGKIEVDKSSAEYEQRYLKYLATLDELRHQYAHLQDMYHAEFIDLKDKCGRKEEQVDEDREQFMQYKKMIGLKSLNSRSGRPIPPKDLELLLAAEQKKESEVVSVRLENIKLQNKLYKEEMALKSKEELAEGLHLIDFEQLKIENQTYNEKIEERNEELLKLRKKITNTVQVLTHLKEKLQFVYQENHNQRDSLSEVDGVLTRKRDLLSQTKQARDALRLDNNKLRQNCGLLGNEMLLRDMEFCVDSVDSRKKALDMMRMEHAEISLRTNGLRRKIEQSKSADPGGRH